MAAACGASATRLVRSERGPALARPRGAVTRSMTTGSMICAYAVSQVSWRIWVMAGSSAAEPGRISIGTVPRVGPGHGLLKRLSGLYRQSDLGLAVGPRQWRHG